MKAVTRPTAEHGSDAVSFGHAGGGVCFVFPRTLALVAPADETMPPAISPAQRIANATAESARLRGPVVEWLVPVIGYPTPRARPGCGSEPPVLGACALDATA
jgi:hypothetical protein